MILIVPMRAALGIAATLSVACAAIEVRAEDSSPWQRDTHSAIRLLAGSRSGAVLLGGKHQIVLPLRIVAKNADKPVTLRADINYAVCEKLCIPVDAKAELAFASGASTEDSALFA